MENKKRKLYWIFCAKAGLSVALLWYLVSNSDISLLVDRVSEIPLLFVVLAWIYYTMCTMASAYRWQLFLSAKGIPVPLSKLLSYYFVGMFANNFLPGALGGDVVKSWDLYRLTRRGDYAVATVFLDRFAGIAGLTILAITAAAASINLVDSPLIGLSVYGSLAILIAVTSFFWFDAVQSWILPLVGRFRILNLGPRLGNLYSAIHSFKSEKRTWIITILISVAIQFFLAAYYKLTAMVLGIEVGLIYFILFLPAVTIATFIPVSLGGLGVREAALVVLFGQVGIASADVLSISLTVHVINTALSGWGGLILLIRKLPRERHSEIR